MNGRFHMLCCGLLLAGCGDAGPADAPAGNAAAAPGAAQAVAAPATRAEASPSLAGRTRELVNPDHATMVLLYFNLAGIAPPVDSWVQQDGRLVSATPADKQAMRETIRREMEAGMAAVKDTGRLRLSLQNAQLSHYDPNYGEFTVRALSPASTIRFTAFRHTVELRFANGRSAQVWRVPADEASRGGGTLVTDVLEYELRETRGGATIARVRLDGS